MSEGRTGLLIVFEGTDGTGKTSQRDLLATALGDRGYPVVVTKEPTDGDYGRQIRQLYQERHRYSREEELQLFLADRRQHVAQLLLPALADGRIILCDRYFYSTAAYQGALGLDPRDILAMNDFAPRPDLLLLFAADLDLCLKRITEGRGEVPNSFEQKDFLRRVANIYDTFDLPFLRTIDASRPMAEVHQAVLAEVLPLLPPAPSPRRGHQP